MFSELDLRIADLLVTQIEVALQNAELHARVSEAAVRDQLTGLLNRRYFDEAVETAFANAARSGAQLSLIVLDLDRFSEVNNVHGHAVGDTVLRRVARAMAGAVRTGDIVARYGGEEFVVIAPALRHARTPSPSPSGSACRRGRRVQTTVRRARRSRSRSRPASRHGWATRSTAEPFSAPPTPPSSQPSAPAATAWSASRARPRTRRPGGAAKARPSTRSERTLRA